MKIIKGYFSTVILAIICLSIICYSQYCYALSIEIKDGEYCLIVVNEKNQGDGVLDKETAEKIVKTIKESSISCFLEVHNIRFVPEALQIILDALGMFGKFSGFVLEECNLAPEDIQKIAGALSENRSLTRFVLLDNIADEGVMQLIDALPSTNLNSLSLPRATINTESISSIADILPRTRLVHLNFGFGNFEDNPLTVAGGTVMMRDPNYVKIWEALRANSLIGERRRINILYRIEWRSITGNPELFATHAHSAFSNPDLLRNHLSAAVSSSSSNSNNATTDAQGVALPPIKGMAHLNFNIETKQ